MNFLAPQFLFGLFAISIPIVIHLFNFRKARKVYFSSNKFLRLVNEETSAKRNIKHLLILLSRVLFIVFLVMAFARPYIPSEQKALQSNVQIYLDNSYSMSNEYDEDLSAFDQAVRIVDDLLDQYPSGTRFRILTNDFAPFSNVFRSSDEIKEILTELSYSKISREGYQIREKMRTEEVSSEKLDNYWISDFQSSLYSGPLKDTLNARLIPISFTSNSNIFIDTVYTETPFLESSDRLRLFARLVNRGEREVDNLVLKVFVNDNQVTTNTITVPPRGTELAEFDITLKLDEINRGMISFEDFPVTFDNEFYFILNKQQRIKIVEIGEKESSQRIGQVYGNTDLFDYQTFLSSNINYSEVENADLVILNEISNLDNALQVLLENYLENFGKLAIIPSKISNTSDFSSLLGLNINQIDSSLSIDLAVPDFDNPFFEGIFEDRNQNMNMPSSQQVWSWFNDRDALIKYANGVPFLSSINSNGIAYIFSSPLSSDYSDFSSHALFVPVMYKLAIFGNDQNQGLYTSLSEEQFIISLDSIGENALLKLSNSTDELIPPQRFRGNEVIIDLPSEEVQTGFYNVFLNDYTVTQIAFNHDNRESVLIQLDEIELLSTFTGSQVEIFKELMIEDKNDILYAKYQPTPLWKYAILLSLLFLVAEVMLFKLMK